MERYECVLAASARLVAALEQRSPDQILTRFKDNLLHWSPLAGAEAAVLREGKLLLIRRRDDGLWALPGGLVEVGETLAEAARRELWEETGIHGRVTQLLGIFDSRIWRSRDKAQLDAFVFRAESDDLPTVGSEVLDAQFFAEKDLPPLSSWHYRRVSVIFKLLRGEMPAPYFDNFGLTSRIDSRVEVRPSPIGGKGIFANAPIKRGEVIIVWGGTIFSAPEISAGEAAGHSYAAIDEGLYLGSAADEGNSPDDFMNHSCDPNIWMQDEVTLVARRDIAADEELTVDYALFEGDENWTARCHSERSEESPRRRRDPSLRSG